MRFHIPSIYVRPNKRVLSEGEKYTSEVVSNMSTISNKPTALTKKQLKSNKKTPNSLPLFISLCLISMASSEVVQHDQVETNTTSPNNPPLVLLNRTSVFDLSYDTWRPTTKFRFLNPLDPSSSTPEAQTLAQSARVILCLGPSAVTKDTIDRYLDHVDLPECRRRGITVTNAGDAYSADVADIAVALLVDVLRRVSASNRYLRAGLWPVRGDYLLGSKLGEKEIGIVGLGSIGSMIAKRLESFGCKIAYNSRRKKPHILFPYYANVQDLATNSDVLVFCCALTNETFHIINKDVMTALGKEGVIANVRDWCSFWSEVTLEVQGSMCTRTNLTFLENCLDWIMLFYLRIELLQPQEAILAVQEVVMANLEAFFANKPLVSQVVLE